MSHDIETKLKPKMDAEYVAPEEDDETKAENAVVSIANPESKPESTTKKETTPTNQTKKEEVVPPTPPVDEKPNDKPVTKPEDNVAVIEPEEVKTDGGDTT